MIRPDDVCMSILWQRYDHTASPGKIAPSLMWPDSLPNEGIEIAGTFLKASFEDKNPVIIVDAKKK